MRSQIHKASKASQVFKNSDNPILWLINLLVVFFSILGIGVDISLYRNKPEIAIDQFDSTSVDYVVNIKSALLHCPIGKLSSEVFMKYEMNLQKQVATLRLKRWMVKVQPITKGTTLFETNILFGTPEVPSRLFVGKVHIL